MVGLFPSYLLGGLLVLLFIYCSEFCTCSFRLSIFHQKTSKNGVPYFHPLLAAIGIPPNKPVKKITVIIQTFNWQRIYCH